MAIEIYTNLSLETTPTAPQHLVPMSWVEDFVAARVKMPVRVVATTPQAGTYAGGAAMTFTYTAFGATHIDGVTLALNDRVLLVDQNPATHNGIFTVTHVGVATDHTILTRASDFNASNKIFSGVTVGVNQGDDFSHTFFKLTSDDPITLDTTPLTWLKVTPPISTRKFSEQIQGDGTKTSWEIEHELGSESVHVQVYKAGAFVLTTVEVVDDDTVEVSFDVAPTSTQIFDVVVIG